MVATKVSVLKLLLWRDRGKRISTKVSVFTWLVGHDRGKRIATKVSVLTWLVGHDRGKRIATKVSVLTWLVGHDRGKRIATKVSVLTWLVGHDRGKRIATKVSVLTWLVGHDRGKRIATKVSVLTWLVGHDQGKRGAIPVPPAVQADACVDSHTFEIIDMLSKDGKLCLLVGCLTSRQHASVCQGRMCLDNLTCFYTETEVADQTILLTQSQYTDRVPTSPSVDSVRTGAWQSSHWGANSEVSGMTRPGKIPMEQPRIEPRSAALEADTLTTRPTRQSRRTGKISCSANQSMLARNIRT